MIIKIIMLISGTPLTRMKFTDRIKSRRRYIPYAGRVIAIGISCTSVEEENVPYNSLS